MIKLRKKAQIFDVLIALVLIAVFGITAVLGLTIHKKYSAKMDESGSQYAKDTLDEFDAAWDNIEVGYVVFVGGVFVAVVISAFLIPTHPIFFGVSIFLAIFVMIISGQIANIYSEFIDSEVGTNSINESATGMATITFVNTNLPKFSAALIVLFLLALYAKWRSG